MDTTTSGTGNGGSAGRAYLRKLEDLGDEIADVACRIEMAKHRLLTLIREFDEKGGWAQQGAITCAHASETDEARAARLARSERDNERWRWEN